MKKTQRKRKTYLLERGILNPIRCQDNLPKVREGLITPHQNLIIGVSIGSVTPNLVTDGGETSEGKSR